MLPFVVVLAGSQVARLPCGFRTTTQMNGVTIDNAFVPGPIAGVNGFDIPASTQALLTANDGAVNFLDHRLRYTICLAGKHWS